MPSSITEDVVILLARASAAAVRAAQAALEPYGLRARHHAALRLAATGEGTAQRQVAAALGLDPSAVVALVDDLEERRLVRRRLDPADRRTRLITLTADGAELLRLTSDVVHEVQSRVMVNLPESQRSDFVDLLRRVVGADGRAPGTKYPTTLTSG